MQWVGTISSDCMRSWLAEVRRAAAAGVERALLDLVSVRGERPRHTYCCTSLLCDCSLRAAASAASRDYPFSALSHGVIFIRLSRDLVTIIIYSHTIQVHFTFILKAVNVS